MLLRMLKTMVIVCCATLQADQGVWFSLPRYRKVPKFLDAKNFAVIYLKFKQRGQTLRYFVKIANSGDPDQTAPLGEV